MTNEKYVTYLTGIGNGIDASQRVSTTFDVRITPDFLEIHEHEQVNNESNRVRQHGYDRLLDE
jgi:hypothetical protein